VKPLAEQQHACANQGRNIARSVREEEHNYEAQGHDERKQQQHGGQMDCPRGLVRSQNSRADNGDGTRRSSV